ncbi:MAG: integrase arm-type DNA-binding domain-containing protein [Hyphomicrobiaceae bacterium]|nr:integrase arm-type DNA-binding domain-containing protein [Hyphomicrobiaceae bacterium]
MPRIAPINTLTTLQCQNVKGPAVLNDGRGLRLVVSATNQRKWVLRVTIDGRQRDLGLGAFREVSLKEARIKADAMRQRIGTGASTEARPSVAPARHKPARLQLLPEPALVTVEMAFQEFWETKKPQLSNPKHAAQWESTLATYAFPLIGDRSVADITTREVGAVLRPIWRQKPETAQRVQQRLKMIFDYAIASGYRTAANPTYAVQMILGARNHTVTHHRALPYPEVPKLIARLRSCGTRPMSHLAFEWLILTATRSSETRLATIDEVDLGTGLWTIPADRMKARQPHQVPLANRCREIFAQARQLAPDAGIIFPAWRGGATTFSNAVFADILEDLKLADQATAHGMRSAFRDWSADCARANHDVAEACLAHRPRDKVVAAYLRTTFLEQRRALMEHWAAYCTSLSEKAGVAVRDSRKISA